MSQQALNIPFECQFQAMLVVVPILQPVRHAEAPPCRKWRHRKRAAVSANSYNLLFLRSWCPVPSPCVTLSGYSLQAHGTIDCENGAWLMDSRAQRRTGLCCAGWMREIGPISN